MQITSRPHLPINDVKVNILIEHKMMKYECKKKKVTGKFLVNPSTLQPEPN